MWASVKLGDIEIVAEDDTLDVNNADRILSILVAKVLDVYDGSKISDKEIPAPVSDEEYAEEE
jgi:hypothetical protein